MRRLWVLTVFGFLACGGGETGNGGDGGNGDDAVAALGTATINGVVTFEGTPPANPTIDMAEEPFCAQRHEGQPVDPVVSVQDGMLANVFVRVTAGLPAGPYPKPGEKAVIDQVGCLYTPRVVGVMAGEPLEIRNSDSLSHNIKAVPTENRPFNVSQPRAGMTRDHVFNTPEVMVPLECNVHGWMNAWVGVVDHPYFDTSGEDGSFSISGLPAGSYTIEAWHETLGTRTMEVEVAEGGSVSVTFTYGSST